MKKALFSAVLFLVLGFSQSVMAATMVFNNIGDYQDTFEKNLARNNSFSVDEAITLNVQSVLLINTTELINIKDFLTYTLLDASNTVLNVFRTDIINNSGAGSTAFAEILTNILNPGNYTLRVTGTTGAGSTNGSFHTQGTTLATPIPAAAWLFGSALMGLVGVSRRKASANGLAA